MQVGDIISYHQLCGEEKLTLQKRMNYKTRAGYSIFLMSVRPGAPYEDSMEDGGRILVYEGHDVPKYKWLK